MAKLTDAEKEALADRVVELLKADDPRAALAALAEQVKAGDEGPDGTNSVALGIATALIEQIRR